MSSYTVDYFDRWSSMTWYLKIVLNINDDHLPKVEVYIAKTVI